VTPLSADGANARQISASPNCTLALSTSTEVGPPPATCVTVVLGDAMLSAEMNASSTSFPDEVEKAEVLTVFFAELWSIEVVTSIPIAPHAAMVTVRMTARTAETRSVVARQLRVLSMFFPNV